MAASAGVAPSSVSVGTVVAVNKTVSPVSPRTPGAASVVLVAASVHTPLVVQDVLVAEFHCACEEKVTVAVALKPPLAARTTAVPLA